MGNTQNWTDLHMTIPINDEVHEYLLSLGKTPDQVAETLQAQGIKGYRASADSCPLANALNAHYGAGVQAFVTHTDVTLARYPVASDANNDYLIVNPLQIAEFVEAFDRGVYPELELDTRCAS